MSKIGMTFVKSVQKTDRKPCGVPRGLSGEPYVEEGTETAPRLSQSGLYCAEHQCIQDRLPLSVATAATEARLRRHPLCVRCKAQGRFTAATVVDHIIPHRGDPHLMWDESNWQALCKSCHDRKTWTEDRNPVYRY